MKDGKWHGVFLQCEDGILAYGYKNDRKWVSKYRVIDQYDNYIDFDEAENKKDEPKNQKYMAAIKMLFTGQLKSEDVDEREALNLVK